MTDLTITGYVKTVGREQVQALAADIDKLRIRMALNNDFQKARAVLFQREITQMAEMRQEAQIRSRYTDTQIRAIAKQRFETQQYNQQVDRRIRLEMEILRLKQEGVTGNRAYLMGLAQERIAHEENNRLLQERRRFLFQTAFALFAVSINIQFMLQSLIRLTEGDKEAAKSLKQLQAAFTLLIGPMQLTLGLMQLFTIQSALVRRNILLMVGAGSILLPLIIALTTNSEKLRQVMILFTVAMGFLNAAMVVYRWNTIAATVATWKHVIAKIYELVITKPLVGILLAGAGIAAAFALSSLLPQQDTGAQTQVGYSRRIKRTRGHLGEDVFIGRPGSPQPIGGGATNVFISLDGGPFTRAVVNRVDVDKVAGVL